MEGKKKKKFNISGTTSLISGVLACVFLIALVAAGFTYAWFDFSRDIEIEQRIRGSWFEVSLEEAGGRYSAANNIYIEDIFPMSDPISSSGVMTMDSQKAEDYIYSFMLINIGTINVTYGFEVGADDTPENVQPELSSKLRYSIRTGRDTITNINYADNAANFYAWSEPAYLAGSANGNVSLQAAFDDLLDKNNSKGLTNIDPYFEYYKLQAAVPGIMHRAYFDICIWLDSAASLEDSVGKSCVITLTLHAEQEHY